MKVYRTPEATDASGNVQSDARREWALIPLPALIADTRGAGTGRKELTDAQVLNHLLAENSRGADYEGEKFTGIDTRTARRDALLEKRFAEAETDKRNARAVSTLRRIRIMLASTGFRHEQFAVNDTRVNEAGALRPTTRYYLRVRDFGALGTGAPLPVTSDVIGYAFAGRGMDKAAKVARGSVEIAVLRQSANLRRRCAASVASVKITPALCETLRRRCFFRHMANEFEGYTAKTMSYQARLVEARDNRALQVYGAARYALQTALGDIADSDYTFGTLESAAKVARRELQDLELSRKAYAGDLCRESLARLDSLIEAARDVYENAARDLETARDARRDGAKLQYGESLQEDTRAVDAMRKRETRAPKRAETAKRKEANADARPLMKRFDVSIARYNDAPHTQKSREKAAATLAKRRAELKELAPRDLETRRKIAAKLRRLKEVCRTLSV